MGVDLLAITGSEQLIAQAYGICTGRDSISLDNIQKWIKRGHETPVEHCSATFRISDVSRSLLAQITRHRLASFSVQSTRYTDVCTNEKVYPEGYQNHHLFTNVYDVATLAYTKALTSGIAKEDARFLLPLALTTEFIMTANLREWRHIIKLRCDGVAQWEIRNLCTEILSILYEQYPHVFEDLYEEFIND